MLWVRTLIAKSLVGAKFSLGVSEGQLAVEITPAVGRSAVPWHFSGKEGTRFKLFSTNSKMKCPTFDLPAGVNELGGSCPGAVFAQSTVPGRTFAIDANSNLIGANSARFLLDEVRAEWQAANRFATAHGLTTNTVPDDKLHLNKAVCQRCYATGGKYSEAVVQFSEVARLAFVQALMADETGQRTLHDLLVRTMEETLRWSAEDVERHKIRPVRIHSSGDFFSIKYAAVMLAVARTLHEHQQGSKQPPIVLWAPTRTWALPGWNKFWRQAQASGHIPPNFIIRPSAYSVDDPAPYTHRPSPTNSKGTAVLWPDDARERIVRKGKAEFGDGSKFDYQCGVYALEKGSKTCLAAVGPDGKRGCRACWKNPELSVSYALH
jgi:hypothetical protein